MQSDGDVSFVSIMDGRESIQISWSVKITPLQRLCQDIISAAKKTAWLLIGCSCAQQHKRSSSLRGRDHMIYAVKKSPPITPAVVIPGAVTASSSNGGCLPNNGTEPTTDGYSGTVPVTSFSFAQKCIDQDNSQTYLRNHSTVYSFASANFFYCYLVEICSLTLSTLAKFVLEP